MDSYYLYQRQYRETGGTWKNTSIYSVDGWGTQEKVVAQIDPSECDEWNPTDDCKVTLTLEDCSEVCIPCDGSRSITRADLGEYKNRAIIAEFGCCIDTIDGVFQGDTKIKKVIIPDCITAITEASFYGTDIEGLVIPASVTYIGRQAKKLAGLKWARFLGTVPPTLAAYCSLGGNCPIYVPPAYVNVYKTATIWNDYANRIQAWNGQVETDYEVECTPPPPTPDTGDTGTTYTIWVEDENAYICNGTDKYHREFAWTSTTGDEGSYIKTNTSRQGSLWESNSVDCGYVTPTQYKWEQDATEYVCDNTTKYHKEYQWSSSTGDDGSWSKTNVSRRGAVWELNSVDCGYAPPQPETQYKWEQDATEYVCDGTDKYHKEYQWSSATGDEGSWEKTGESRMGGFWESNSVDCGYVPPAYYKWEVDYNDYVCDGVDKNFKEYQWSSATGDEGSWVKTSVSRMSGIWEFNSFDCGYGYSKWEEDATEYICNGVNKYHKEYQWSSATGDEGSWVKTGESRQGSLWEANSTDCGYVPPSLKFTLTLNDGSIVTRDCDSTSAITTAETASYSANSVSLVIGDCVTDIGVFAFYNYGSLTSITIPNSVTSIGSQAFYRCSGVTSVIIPSGVTTIEEWAFANCFSLTSVTIPSSVTSIDEYAFIACVDLKTVTIPSGVTNIGMYSFDTCTGLTSITVNAVTPPTIGNYAFNNTNNCPIYVPSGSVDAYKSATNWSSYASRIQAIP